MRGRRRSKAPERMFPPPAAERTNANVAAINYNALDGDREVYMLREARQVYQNERPPFVFGNGPKCSLAGERKVVVLADKDGAKPKLSNHIKVELICQGYDTRTGFWTLDLDDKRFIIRSIRPGGHRGGIAFRIWRGPVEGFDKKATAFSPSVLREPREAKGEDETERPDQDSSPEQSDEEYDARLMDAHQQSSPRNHHSRDAKDKGNARIKSLAAVTAEMDQRPNEKRPMQRLGLRKQKPPAKVRRARPRLPTPSVQNSSSTPVSDSPPARIAVKRERASSRSPDRDSSEPIRRNTRHRTRSPSIIEISHTPNPSIDRYKQCHTTLHISLSTNDYGAVPIYLRSCLTIDTFFASALAAWGLEGRDREVAAVTVKFDWLKDEGPMVVRKQVVDSFQKMLETIAEAPVWRDGDRDGDRGRKGCDVRVKIVMK